MLSTEETGFQLVVKSAILELTLGSLIALVNVRNNVNKNSKDVLTKQLRPSSVSFQLSDGFLAVHNSARAMPAKKHNK